jgi:hypothetical protein
MVKETCKQSIPQLKTINERSVACFEASLTQEEK